MLQVLLVGLGGFMGAVLRYVVGGIVQSFVKDGVFPAGTLIVNLLGCFIIGLLAQFAETRDWLTPQSGSFIFVGLLGAFTTFSTFSNDSMNFFRQGDSLSGVFYVGVHVLLGLAFVWGGRSLAAQIWQ